jgi:hypothetical protein
VLAVTAAVPRKLLVACFHQRKLRGLLGGYGELSRVHV